MRGAIKGLGLYFYLSPSLSFSPSLSPITQCLAHTNQARLTLLNEWVLGELAGHPEAREEGANPSLKLLPPSSAPSQSLPTPYPPPPLAVQ